MGNWMQTSSGLTYVFFTVARWVIYIIQISKGLIYVVLIMANVGVFLEIE
jgi:roadblock/LC7 domain-containing protein